jgi:hypothetical protein
MWAHFSRISIHVDGKSLAIASKNIALFLAQDFLCIIVQIQINHIMLIKREL